MHKAHDHSYKLLFSEPEMVIDLLKGFVHQPWVDGLDFSTLEKVPCSFVTDDFREREDDLIWRVKHQQRWIYVYLLLEFQSSIDRFMAVRVALYTLLLYQDLIKSKKEDVQQGLPPVFPVVLYNGEKRWNSATRLGDLIVSLPGGLERYKPGFEYLLLDEGEFRLSELEPLKNLVAAIFRLENAATREDIVKVIDNLLEWLNTPELQSVKRSFTIWMKRVLLPRKTVNEAIQEINDLTEIRTMLAQTVSKWTDEWLQQGINQGLEQGRSEMLDREKQLLLSQIQRRFDKATTQVAQSIIMTIHAQEPLERVGGWIIDCHDGNEFLEKLKQL